MNPRTTGILFLGAAVLAAFVWFYEIRGADERAEAEAEAKRLFPGFSAEEVTELSLTTSDGRAARAVRRAGDDEGGWDLVEPLAFPGDEFALDGMASALVDLKSEVVFENPQPPAVYGLDDDTAVIRFKAADREHELRLGKDAPVGSNAYAQVGGSDAVYTVPAFGVNALRKSLDDLREKRIARFDRNAVDRIVASWPGGGVELEKGEEGWQIAAPIQGPADQTTVDSLLSDLSFLRATGFVDEPRTPAEAGLEPPDFEVELAGAAEGEGEPVFVTLAIGADLDGEFRLVRAGHDSLFRISAGRLGDLPRELVAYRWKELSSFSPTEVTQIELRFEPRMSTAAGEEAVTITATRGDTGWTSEPETFGPGKVAGIVTALSRLVAADILADEMGPDELDALGLSPPIARIVVRGEGEGEALASLRIGVLRGSEGIAAQRDGSPIVFWLDAGLAERVPVSLEAFRNRFVASEPDPEPLLEAAEPELADPALESP